MPIYVYRCTNMTCLDCHGTTEEEFRRIKDRDEPKNCKVCGEPMTRVIQGTDFRMQPLSKA